jgi:hypothetical protein
VADAWCDDDAPLTEASGNRDAVARRRPYVAIARKHQDRYVRQLSGRRRRRSRRPAEALRCLPLRRPRAEAAE